MNFVDRCLKDISKTVISMRIYNDHMYKQETYVCMLKRVIVQWVCFGADSYNRMIIAHLFDVLLVAARHACPEVIVCYYDFSNYYLDSHELE